MPYLPPARRAELAIPLDRLARVLKQTGGGFGAELNFVICRLVSIAAPDCYAEWQEIIGALECAKQEIYRRQIAEMEDKKRRENGDVF